MFPTTAFQPLLVHACSILFPLRTASRLLQEPAAAPGLACEAEYEHRENRSKGMQKFVDWSFVRRLVLKRGNPFSMPHNARVWLRRFLNGTKPVQMFLSQDSTPMQLYGQHS